MSASGISAMYHIAYQMRVRKLDLLYRQLREIQLWASTFKQWPLLYLHSSTKMVNPMEIVKSPYKRLNICFVAIVSFYKLSRFSKNGCGPKLKMEWNILVISPWNNVSDPVGWQRCVYPAAIVHGTLVQFYHFSNNKIPQSNSG